jgi:excinuclease ABC subunit A
MAVRVEGLSIHEFCTLPIERALSWLDRPDVWRRGGRGGRALLKELTHRLRFLAGVGLDYLCLARNMAHLSGGEPSASGLPASSARGLWV